MFLAGVTLLVVKAALHTPKMWLEPKTLLAIQWQQLVQFSLFGLLGSVSMLAAVSTHRHWLWLLVLIVVGMVVGMLCESFGMAVEGGRWMPMVMTIHPFVIASFWSKLGVQLPRVVRLVSLHRALASVR
jgi:hypothetical protein